MRFLFNLNQEIIESFEDFKQIEKFDFFFINFSIFCDTEKLNYFPGHPGHVIPKANVHSKMKMIARKKLALQHSDQNQELTCFPSHFYIPISFFQCIEYE